MFEALDITLPTSVEPVHVAARRLRWFRVAFRSHLNHWEKELGCALDLDEGVLAKDFVSWLRAVEEQRPNDPAARRDYFEFAAGLMLRELLKNMPVRVRGDLAGTVPKSAAFWPEGYVCTLFCLSIARAALREEFGDRRDLAPEITELRHWWSFRENVEDDPAMAIAFLDMFMGQEPEWSTPNLFSARLRREIVERSGDQRRL